MRSGRRRSRASGAKRRSRHGSIAARSGSRGRAGGACRENALGRFVAGARRGQARVAAAPRGRRTAGAATQYGGPSAGTPPRDVRSAGTLCRSAGDRKRSGGRAFPPDGERRGPLITGPPGRIGVPGRMFVGRSSAELPGGRAELRAPVETDRTGLGGLEPLRSMLSRIWRAASSPRAVNW
jgi:hypothetical protein